MPAETETIAASASHWLARFERALAEPDDVPLRTLFHPDSHWRDVLALTWRIGTVNGRDAILRELKTHAGRASPTGFRTDPQRTAPRRVTRAGTSAIEAIFRFETTASRGSGVLRLIPDAGDGGALKAWTLLTALEEIKGFEEQVGRARPKGRVVLARFSRSQLARPQAICRRLRGPGSGRPGRGRRPGRAFDRRTPRPAAGRHAGRGPRTAYRRQLAQPLSRADPAQPGAGQPPSVHALSAELADLHSERQACRLVRGLRGKHGAQLLDRHGVPGRHLRRGRGAMVRRRSPARMARGGKCVRGTSSWRPASAAFRTSPTSRRCTTSTARSCTPVSTATATRGGEGTRSSSAPATAATTSRRTCTRAGRG